MNKIQFYIKLSLVLLIFIVFPKILLASDKIIYQESVDLFNQAIKYEESESYKKVGDFYLKAAQAEKKASKPRNLWIGELLYWSADAYQSGGYYEEAGESNKLLIEYIKSIKSSNYLKLKRNKYFPHSSKNVFLTFLYFRQTDLCIISQQFNCALKYAIKTLKAAKKFNKEEFIYPYIYYGHYDINWQDGGKAKLYSDIDDTIKYVLNTNLYKDEIISNIIYKQNLIFLEKKNFSKQKELLSSSLNIGRTSDVATNEKRRSAYWASTLNLGRLLSYESKYYESQLRLNETYHSSLIKEDVNQGGVSLGDLIRNANILHNYDEAIRYIEWGLSVEKFRKYNFGISAFLSKLATAKSYKGKTKEAINLRLEALTYLEDNEVHGIHKYHIYGDLALNYILVGQYKEAEKLLLESLAYFDSKDQNHNIAVSLNRLGNIYLNRGNIDKAHKSYLKARTLYDVSNAEQGINDINASLIDLLLIDKKPLEAKKINNKLIDIYKHNKNYPKIISSLLRAASIEMAMSNYTKTLNYLNEAEQIALETNDLLYLKDIRGNKGIALLNNDKFEESLDDLNYALTYSKQINSLPNIATFSLNLARAHFNLKNDEIAIKFLEEAIFIYNKLRLEVTDLKSKLEYDEKTIYAYQLLFINLLKNQNYKKLLEKIESVKSRTLVDKLNKELLDFNNILDNHFYTIYGNTNLGDPILLNINNGRISAKFIDYKSLANLSSSESIIQYVNDPFIPDSYDEIQNNRSNFKKLSSNEIIKAISGKNLIGKFGNGAVFLETHKKNGEYISHSVEKSIGRWDVNNNMLCYEMVLPIKRNQCVLLFGNKKEPLKPPFYFATDGELFFSIVHKYYEEEIHQKDLPYVVDKTLINATKYFTNLQENKFTSKFYRDDLFTTTVYYYRHLLSKNNKSKEELQDQKYLSKLLYNYLIKPIENQLLDKTQMIIVTDGILSILPFETLIDQNGKYLIEKININYTPSLKLLALAKNRNYSDSFQLPILAFGGAIYEDPSKKAIIKQVKLNVEYQNIFENYKNNNIKRGYSELGKDNWLDLPGTLQEIEKIKEITNEATIVVGKDVSEKTIKQMSEDNYLEMFKIIHFATHALTVPEVPELSSLVLSQVGNDTEDGYLTAPEIEKLNLKADFVNLSACETGIGKIYMGEGIMGLIQSLFIAGANSLSVSLWEIADNSTQIFMSQMYSNHFLNNQKISNSIASVKRDFIQGKFGKEYTDPFYWAPYIYYGN